MSFWESLWNIVAVFFWAFMFIAALYALVVIVTDLVRDREVKGWVKAVWLIFLVGIPLVTSVIYLIARGDGMAERAGAQYQQSRQATEDYIRNVAGSSPSDEIAKAKTLLDAGTITPEEYELLKQQALAGSAR